MVRDRQIQKWLDEGLISKKQADQMLADLSTSASSTNQKETLQSQSRFISIITIIGAALIFVGIAWLIARNWHQIHDLAKVLILLGSTLASFFSGVALREKNHEGVGRSLLVLGALLYILSLFLISQIYHLATTEQHYAWIFLLSWTVIMVSSYLLDSRENLVVAMLVFFPWAILQYVTSAKGLPDNSQMVGLFFIFLSAGTLLHGLTLFHRARKHAFGAVYRLFTVFYFLVIFYLLSFQHTLPLLSDYSFGLVSFTPYLWLFLLVAAGAFIYFALFALRRKVVTSKEIAIFVGILAVLILLVFSTKVGAGLVGRCDPVRCPDLETESACNAPPDHLLCDWDEDTSNCKYFYERIPAGPLDTEEELEMRRKQEVLWGSEQEAYELCSENNNQGDLCSAMDFCTWRPGLTSVSTGLPTALWLLWIVNNFAFIAFIILVIFYGQLVGSERIVNLALFTFILEIFSRYIGFWIDYQGYFAFSVLAILGGLGLIFGAIYIPRWRHSLLSKARK